MGSAAFLFILLERIFILHSTGIERKHQGSLQVISRIILYAQFFLREGEETVFFVVWLEGIQGYRCCSFLDIRDSHFQPGTFSLVETDLEQPVIGNDNTMVRNTTITQLFGVLSNGGSYCIRCTKRAEEPFERIPRYQSFSNTFGCHHQLCCSHPVVCL